MRCPLSMYTCVHYGQHCSPNKAYSHNELEIVRESLPSAQKSYFADPMVTVTESISTSRHVSEKDICSLARNVELGCSMWQDRVFVVEPKTCVQVQESRGSGKHRLVPHINGLMDCPRLNPEGGSPTLSVEVYGAQIQGSPLAVRHEIKT